MFKSVNPATGEVVVSYDAHSREEVERRLARAWSCFETFREASFQDRASSMVRAAELLEKEKQALGKLMTEEMGKPIAAGVAEAEKCAWVCRYYAESTEAFLTDELVKTNAQRSLVRYRPLGPVLAVMPWNFPFWQVFRFAAPALMAGNVGLLKHASNVPRCALAIEQIFTQAGFPEGAFQTLLIDSDMVAHVLDDTRVRAATLTGSTRAGSAVAERAGKRVKKTVLELGGSDPFVVMPSADVSLAARTAVRARTINNGQSCIAAKRFIVHSSIYERFRNEMTAGLQSLRVGDPMDPKTEIGPLATVAILAEVESQVSRSVTAGARLLTGGQRLSGPGNFYMPTALDRVPRESPAYREEIFGPVASLFSVDDLEEAIAVANDTSFGLGASVWTNVAAERERLIDGIDAGMIFVNGMVASDPRLPFGGTKGSGYGRELGVWGIREFVNVQTVWIGESNQGATE